VAYQIRLTSNAARSLQGFDPRIQQKVQSVIKALADDPRPNGAKPLGGYPGLLRIRDGDYRMIYRIDHDRNMVEIVRIGHRREIYRRLP
jgi:mRNA interferase RelE/StbE